MDREQLEKDGWILSTVSGGAHLQRWLEDYKELGYEVFLEKIDIDEEDKEEAGCGSTCTICFDNESEPPYRVYIRPKRLG